jgi:hypothetical protein
MFARLSALVSPALHAFVAQPYAMGAVIMALVIVLVLVQALSD